MGSAMCLRRQKGLGQVAFCLLVLLCLGSGLFFYAHLLQNLKTSESLALKYKQQQEALSGQLQDFLVYKLEAQEALNKEKQDAMNRYGALSSEHKILKNQHEDVKKQLLDMQVQHNSLKLEHRKTLEGHSQKYSLLQREKENDIVSLQGAVSRLREENRLLRKAHQEIHLQLHTAQAQMEELRQLKEALQRIPSFKQPGVAKGHMQQQPGEAAKKIFGVGSPGAVPNPFRGGEQLEGVLQRGQENPGINTLGQPSQSTQGTRLQGGSVFRPQAPPQDAGQPVSPQWPKKEKSEVYIGRTVNSLQDGNLGQKLSQVLQDKNKAENIPMAEDISTETLLSVTPESQETGTKQVHSWQDTVNKDSARMGEQQLREPPQGDPDPKRQQGVPPAIQEREMQAETEAAQDRAEDEDLELGTERLDREEDVHLMREPATQELVMAAAADAAQDPNNQGEDEFEEAELERPDFEEKVGGVDKIQKLLKEGENREAKENHEGETDDTEDLELIQGKEEPGDNPEAKRRKAEYY